MDQQLVELFHRFVGLAFDRQLRFVEFRKQKAAGEKWKFDQANAVLSFGPKLKFTAPLVGAHVTTNNTWTWTWANRTVKLSITNRALGDTVRALAHKTHAPEFARHAFPLTPIIGADLTPHAANFFGTILVGELDYDAYYIAPFSGGEAVLLVRDDRLRGKEKKPLERIQTVFPKVLDAYPVPDPRAAFLHYAQSFALDIVESGNVVKVTGSGSGELKATFDDRGRLVSLAGAGAAKKAKVIAKKPAVKPKAVAKKKTAKASRKTKKR